MYVSIGGVDVTQHIYKEEYSVYETDELVDEWQSANGRHHEHWLRPRVMGTIKFAFFTPGDYADFITLFNDNVNESKVLTITVFVMNANETREIEAYFTITPDKHLDYNLDYTNILDTFTLQLRER